MTTDPRYSHEDLLWAIDEYGLMAACENHYSSTFRNASITRAVREVVDAKHSLESLLYTRNEPDYEQEVISE